MTAKFIICAGVDRSYEKQLGFDVAVTCTWPSKRPTWRCTFVRLTVVDVYEIPRNQRPELRSLPPADRTLRDGLRGRSIRFEVDGLLFDQVVCERIGELADIAGVEVTRWDWAESLEKARDGL